jgi:hypothetical protein
VTPSPMVVPNGFIVGLQLVQVTSADQPAHPAAKIGQAQSRFQSQLAFIGGVVLLNGRLLKPKQDHVHSRSIAGALNISASQWTEAWAISGQPCSGVPLSRLVTLNGLVAIGSRIPRCRSWTIEAVSATYYRLVRKAEGQTNSGREVVLVGSHHAAAHVKS